MCWLESWLLSSSALLFEPPIISSPMDPRVALDLGIIKVHWYGILVTLGIFVGTYIAALELRRRGINPNVAWDGVVWVAGLGIIGARLYHVFSSPNDGSGSGWAYYSRNLFQIFAIWNGGLGIFGGLLGGAVGVLIVARRYRVDLRALCDSIAPGLALGQAIGRWGNYFNQELYGGPTGVSWWGITIAPPYRIRTPSIDFTDLNLYPPETRFHPTFFYESAWNFVGFLLMLWLSRRSVAHLKPADLAAAYFIWYGAGRSWIELLFRPDAWTIGALPTAVIVGLGLVGAGCTIIALNHLVLPRQRPSPRPA